MMRITVYSVLALVCSYTKASAPDVMYSVALKWDFEDGRNGWAQSTPLEMGMDVEMIDGHLRGVVLPSAKRGSAFVDSPELRVEIDPDERDHLVFRMKYLGQCELAMVALERNSKEPAIDPGIRRERTKLHDPVRIPFRPYINSLESHIYVLPIWKHMAGTIHRIRFFPCVTLPKGVNAHASGQTFHIDWVAFAKAPVITKVRGCIDQYFDTNSPIARMNCTERIERTNGYHASSSFRCFPVHLPIASTYNCLRQGGERIRINGKHFGTSDAIVTIDGAECVDVVHTVPETEVECTLPSASASSSGSSIVRVQNGQLQDLDDRVPFLRYAAAVSARPTPVISNVAAHALDVNWIAPADVAESMTVTGYVVQWKKCSVASFAPEDTVVVGNVTSTTLVGLERASGYQAVVTPLTEDQRQRSQWQSIDLYGRRKILPNAVHGKPSPLSACVSTRSFDVEFPSFDARSLTNRTSPGTNPTIGPTGEIGDQGHVGLYVNGHANIQNCNASESCCDGFQSPGGCSLVCSVVENRVSGFTDGKTNRTIATNAAFAQPTPAKIVLPRATFTQVTERPPITASCGPALRLTGSHPLLTGTAWYPRQLNVREGFETDFAFRLSNPSTVCPLLDDVHTNCRSRGGDGFAFVLQNDGAIAMGSGGMELGYGNLREALAVEFDTWYNYEQQDLYENHISVHVGRQVAANHSFSIGATTTLPDLADHTNRVRILYTPQLEQDMVFANHFVASAYAGSFFSAGAWATGVGMLQVFVNDFNTPVLSVPLRLESSMELHHGRAWVGFTAATGKRTWQTHDILSWSFRSLRIPMQDE